MKHKHILPGFKSHLFILILSILCIANAWGETKTGTITFDTNDIKINSASVAGNDDLGNSWTITTTGTTSFTSQPTYYQVGSASNPATSITFTTTLAEEKTFTAFSAKFGGFSGTAGSIQLKVGTTVVGTGSLNATNDVTVSNTKSESGTVLTVTVTGIAKGVKCYSITYSYEDSNTTPVAVSHNVTFSINGTEITRSYNVGDDIIIPSAPNDIFGKKFIGWTTNPILEDTDIEPELVKPAATMGEADLTYYAVYATTHETWNRISELSNITNGSYVIINGGFVLPNATTGSSTPPTEISAPTTDGSTITGDPSENMKWQFISTELDYQFYIKNSENKFLYETNNNNGLRVGNTNDSWTFEMNTDGYFAMRGSNNNRYCAKYKDGSDWRSYTSATATNYANGGKIELYKLNTTYSDYCTIITATSLDMVANFYESFDTNEGTGGNDGQWSGAIATNDIKSIHIGWSFSNGKGASECIKLGSGSQKGRATTPVISFSGTATISFKAAAWDGIEERTNINIIASQGDLSQTSVSLKKGEWETFTVTIRNVVTSTLITFESVNDRNNRFFLDEVQITQKGDVSLVAQTDDSYYATFSRPYDVQIEDDVVVYAVVEHDGGIGFCKITNNKIPANTGALLRSKGSGPYTYNVIGSADSFDGNLLRPASETMSGSFKFYKLAYNNYNSRTGLGFYYGAAEGGSFTCKEGTAYLAIPNGLSASRMRSFTFDDMEEATGIEDIADTSVITTDTIYTLSGQRVGRTSKGLYIVNGKKVLNFRNNQ